MSKVLDIFSKYLKILNKYKKSKIALAGLFLLIILVGIFWGTFRKSNMKSVEAVSEVQTENFNEDEQPIVVTLEEDDVNDANVTGTIYLTFDDGPSNSTPQILDILQRNNIKATFFVIHYDENNEQYIKRESSQGETIALHGYTHIYSDIYSSVDACMENFEKIQQQVLQTTGKKSNIIRFPGGSSNTISKKYCEGIMTELTGRVLNEGYKYFDWNVDSCDAGSAKTSEAVYNNVVSGISKHKESIVLMHDFANNNKTIEALQGIIDYAKSNGYVFKRITNNTKMVTHEINN